MFIYIFLVQTNFVSKNFRKFQVGVSETLKFRFVCKHWSVYFGFQCLFTFFWLFVLVSNIYLHFFGVNTLYFQKFSKI